MGIFAVRQLPVRGTHARLVSPEGGVGTSAHVSSTSHSVPCGHIVAQNAFFPESTAHAVPRGQLCARAQGSQTSTISTGGSVAASGAAGVPPRSTSVPHAGKPAAARSRMTGAALRSGARLSLRGSMGEE